MSSILVVEREPQDQERIQAALRSEGWRVRVFAAADQAMQSAAAETPDLVVVSADVPGGDAVASSLSRNAGGPGVVGLVPPLTDGSGASALEADDLIAKPFSDQELREAVRRGLDAKRRAAADSLFEAPAQKLTSQDIFGDVLAEMEEEMPAGSFAPPARPASPSFRPPAPAPATPAAAAVPPAAPRPSVPADDDIQRKLEQTLSGVLGTEPRRAASAPGPAASAATGPAAPAPPARKPAAAAGADVDALLSKTLSNLDLGTRTPRPAQAPAPPAPSVAPAGLAATQPIPAQPRPAPPAAPPAAPAASAAAAPAEARKGRMVGDFDFSELEELARPGRRPEPERPPAPVPAPVVPSPEMPPAMPASEAAATVAVPIPSSFAPPPADESPFDLDLAPELPEPPPFAFEEPEAPAPAAPEPPRDVRAGLDGAATQWIPVTPAPPREEGDAGQTFGQYTLLERIAVGGMAEVWKARMRGVEGFQKTVAIKKILTHMTDNSEFIEMFVDEAKLAAQLSHPNIVHIYDLGRIHRDYYIAMEYVDGKDLRSLLNAARRKNLPLPVGLALLITARLAGALDHAHRKRDFEGHEMNLVHRDVSPQNVLLAYEGDVKLCDFGIAKAVSKASHTQMGALKGKLQYMSPEQAWGRVVDSRSDIFSLGAVLFEMLTGERLFTGETEMSVLEAVRHARIRLPRQIDPSLPAEVDEIVGRALAVEPQDRYATAGEMQQRIEALMRTLSPPPTHADLAAYLQRVLAPEPERAEPQSVSFTPVAPQGTPAAAAASPSPDAPPVQPLQPEREAPAPPAHIPEEAVPAGAAGAGGGESGGIVFPTPLSPFDRQEPAPGPDPAPVQPVAPVGEVPADAVEGGSPKGRGLLYAAIVILILAAILTFLFLGRRGSLQEPGEGTPPPAEEAPAPALQPDAAQPQDGPAPQGQPPAAPPAAGAANPALTEEQVKAVMDQEKAAMELRLARREEELRRKLEDQERKLRKELERTQTAAEAPPGAASEAAEPSSPPV